MGVNGRNGVALSALSGGWWTWMGEPCLRWQHRVADGGPRGDARQAVTWLTALTASTASVHPWVGDFPTPGSLMPKRRQMELSCPTGGPRPHLCLFTLSRGLLLVSLNTPPNLLHLTPQAEQESLKRSSPEKAWQ